ncbi:uncharacterized protein EKO05_0006868 [Ascochyta rabiei]|uniref:Zinc ion binding n=1 Tax=Didymella rabiei TaxID=5454 RepID=A0A162Z726_DIDRA|nr:uncharacterized protein EKO05_0006868 [Ascochyta rabiei]KZM20432.1 zinc ion binding [Ascochyta rabiei]UPX16470.1 hypothetical protein EKO05_0006868 [Ascochyta rabiei]
MSSFEADCSFVDAEDWLVIQVPWYFLSPPDSSCPICREDSFGIIVKTICGHVFHGQCLLGWFQSLSPTADYTNYDCTCPMCRKVLATVFRSHDEAEQYSEEQDELSEGVGDEEESTNLVETSSNYNDREETDHLAQTLRGEAEQELQHRQLQLNDFLDLIHEDEESLKPPLAMYGGCLSLEGGTHRDTEEYNWSSTSGSFIPTRLLLSHEQTNEEEEFQRLRRMYCIRLQINDAREKIKKLTAMLGNPDVQVSAGQGSSGWF